MKKKLIGIFVCMLLIGTVLSVSGNVLLKRASNPVSAGDILYVGGSGPNNYTTIQSAISDAVDGDTVFVYDDSAPYFEKLLIDVPINLIGEDRDTTVIDGIMVNNHLPVIKIISDFVSIQGFSLVETDPNQYGQYNDGILIFSDNNEIKDNIIKDNIVGIQLGENYPSGISPHNNVITGNIIEDNVLAGILLDEGSSYNTISHNTITSNHHGIFLHSGENKNNVISFNKISNSVQLGIWLLYNDNKNSIHHNIFINNNDADIFLEDSFQNNISKNNFFDNKKEIILSGDIWELIMGNSLKSNIIDSNYWGEERSFPKPIIGIYGILNLIPLIPTIIFDRNPAQEPYDIGV